jgi:predicted nucleic-acid-binding Zn-ribbon protein
MTTKRATKKATKRGRPAGRKSQAAEIAEASPSRCPKCGSTEREPYWKKREVEASGTTADGHVFDTIVLRWTKCAHCRQTRVDRSHELRH